MDIEEKINTTEWHISPDTRTHKSKQAHIVPHISDPASTYTHTPTRTRRAIVCPGGARGADGGGDASCGEGRAASGEDARADGLTETAGPTGSRA